MSRYFNRRPKRGRRKTTTDSSIKQEVQDKILTLVQDEFTVADKNQKGSSDKFDEFYDMLHCERDNKANDWESDIFLPEFTSRMLSQIADFVGRYFASRDYVAVDLDSDDPQDVAEGKASKNLLNRVLTDPANYYYYKILRLLMFVFAPGYGIIKGGYVQKTETKFTHNELNTEYVADEQQQYLAQDGSVFTDPVNQQPMTNQWEEPVYKDVVLEDRPIFDVFPNNCVYMSTEWQYSIQDKEYIIFEDMPTIDQLEAEKEQHDYFNLHLLDNITTDTQREHRDKTTGKSEDYDEPETPIMPKIVRYERWGKFPLVVKTRDERGIPTDWKPGLDKDGYTVDKAEMVECIITTVKASRGANLERLIGFRPSPFSKRPMVRFICYVDPLKDNGFGDGETSRELQVAINDNYNLMNYRTRLAITPSFKGKKFSGIPSQVQVSPETVLMLENLDDLQELKIEDNIQGGIIHNEMLSRAMDYAMARSPVTMGQAPARQETATMGALMDRHSASRENMKSLNLEFIGFDEFYDMLLTLCNDFMLPETLKELIGDDAYNYNPNRKDKFRPVSQALDTEENKQAQIRMLDQIMGRVVSLPNPKTPMVVNYLMGMILERMGGDFKHFKKFMFDESPESIALYQLVTGGKLQPQMQPGMGGGPQNQMGMPQSATETQTREAASA